MKPKKLYLTNTIILLWRLTIIKEAIKMKALTLTSEEKNKLIEKIQEFFYTERDEKIGIIAAEVILDFFLDTLGTAIYNKSLMDAKAWFMKRMDDLDADFDSLYK